MKYKKNQVGGQNRYYEENNYLFYLFFFLSEIEAATINDYQIEKLIHEYISTIKSANQYNNEITFRIILDNNPNAFIDRNRTMFVSTGLIKYIYSYEALIGVLAHEIGHLNNFHISKKIESIKNLKSLNSFGTLSVIASSILTKNAIIEPLIFNNVGIQNYYSAFSREQEREADVYASETLNKLNLSSTPLKEFLEFLEEQSIKKGIVKESFKFSSHPVYKERYQILENYSKKNNFEFNKENDVNFKFVKAKIFGYTEIESIEITEYLKDDFYDYANSIILSRKGKLKESLIIINDLINKYPANIFLVETKADLLFAHGYTKEASQFYKKVLKKYPDNYYIKKRIFEIEFESFEEKTYLFNSQYFSEYSDLIFIFEKDDILLKKFRKLGIYIKNDEWVNYINAQLFINEQLYKKAKKLLNEIIINSKNIKLISNSKNKLKKIIDE